MNMGVRRLAGIPGFSIDRVAAAAGVAYDPDTEVTITGGEGDAMLDALLCTTDPGDGVIVTDPTYAGIVNRVRLAGAVPRLVPLRVEHSNEPVPRLELLRHRLERALQG
jgi:aspartate/methionine/tyrosine aminotransferase